METGGQGGSGSNGTELTGTSNNIKKKKNFFITSGTAKMSLAIMSDPPAPALKSSHMRNVLTGSGETFCYCVLDVIKNIK